MSYGFGVAEQALAELMALSEYRDDQTITILEPARRLFSGERAFPLTSIVVCFSEHGDQLS